MSRKTSFIAGMLTMVLLASLFVTASAKMATVNKQLLYRDIRIVLNGKAVSTKDANGNSVEPFVIDGTTYLPIRAVGEALGLNVGWDQATQTVTLVSRDGGQGSGDKTPQEKEDTSPVVLYDDKYVRVAFNGCNVRTTKNPVFDDSLHIVDYITEYSTQVNLQVTNKTGVPLDFYATSFAFDGRNYDCTGVHSIAAASTGDFVFNLSGAEISLDSYTAMNGLLTFYSGLTDVRPFPTYFYEVYWTAVEISS